MSERFPQPIPFGWFFVAYTDELAAGDVKPVRYFGEDLVLFRTEAGEAGLLEAYCPHLGAHLGHGGEIDGDGIRCPFHAWSFNPQGECLEVPYAKKMPPQVKNGSCMRSYPIQERNQVVWAWYHPQDVAPWFDVMEHEEVGHADWVDLDRYCWTFDSNPQEIAENGVDTAHFKYVHAMDAVPEGKTTYEDHIRNSMAEGPRTIITPEGDEKVITSRVQTVQNGAGQKYSRLSGLTDTLLMVLATPVEKDKVELRFAFTHKDFAKDSVEYDIARKSVASIIGQTGVAGDIPIWNYKIHRANPILCDGDGPIMRYREYFEQFYVDEGDPGKQRLRDAAE